MPQLTKESLERAIHLVTAKGEKCTLCENPVHGPAIGLTLGTGLSWPLPKQMQGVLGISCCVTVIGRMFEVMGANAQNFHLLKDTPNASK